MHFADGAILAIIAISMLFGVFRGFAREAFALAGWVAAYIVARVFHAPLAGLLVDHVSTPSVRLAVAWGGLFVATLLLAALAGYMVRSLMEAAGIRSIDRFFGAIFGLVRGLILVLALLVMTAPFVSRDPWWQQAKLPKEFMRYELVGRELKNKVVQAAKEAGHDEHVSPAAGEAETADHRQP